jgi:ribosomal-protein-alanine N-acetyltransferase
MRVFPAELTDLNSCYQMNASYSTDYVWQMQTRQAERRTDVRFDTVRLPRSMQVEYPRSMDELVDHWNLDACFLVVRNGDDEIIGFVDAQPQLEQGLLWVFNLVVDKNFRQQGIGTVLLKSARQWAMQHQLNKLMLEVQTKNHPAISFAQKHGFRFCGFNERYYPNGDIALFFYQLIH